MKRALKIAIVCAACTLASGALAQTADRFLPNAQTHSNQSGSSGGVFSWCVHEGYAWNARADGVCYAADRTSGSRSRVSLTHGIATAPTPHPRCPDGYDLVADMHMQPKCAREVVDPLR